MVDTHFNTATILSNKFKVNNNPYEPQIQGSDCSKCSLWQFCFFALGSVFPSEFMSWSSQAQSSACLLIKPIKR